MKYRLDKYGNEISILGFGCMRFTMSAATIDYPKAESEIMTAYRGGVNYYDTAYIYPGSEKLLGSVFQQNGIRDKVRIATKLPHYRVKSTADFDRFFDEELSRLRTDHIEYYLMHMMNDRKSFDRIDALGLTKWLDAKKRSGQIEQVGFSYHGNSDNFQALFDAYDWDMCQIQYNYLDVNSQAGKTGLDYAASRGVPVVIMEPLRGGKLANNLPPAARACFDTSKHSPAEWGLRWLWNQPEIMCVLSGMNSLEMVNENMQAADNAAIGMLSPEDLAVYDKVVEEIKRTMKVGCTGCRYCMPCPHNVDIPGTFSAYNNRYTDGWFAAEKEYMMCTALRKVSTAASNCVGCGLCEQHCPQAISIREELKNAQKVLEGPAYKIAKTFLPLFLKY